MLKKHLDSVGGSFRSLCRLYFQHFFGSLCPWLKKALDHDWKNVIWSFPYSYLAIRKTLFAANFIKLRELMIYIHFFWPDILITSHSQCSLAVTFEQKPKTTAAWKAMPYNEIHLDLNRLPRFRHENVLKNIYRERQI